MLGTAMLQNGEGYLASLDDGRCIYLDGQRIDNAAEHPAFKNAAMTVAGLYDMQSQNQELMTFASPVSDKRVALHWKMPTSNDDLVQRRAAMTAWSRYTCGFFGRSPDHIPSALCGMLMAADRFREHDPKRADALKQYMEYARERNLYLTYSIVNPQSNQSKSPSEQGGDSYPACRVVDEDSEGITVDGAKMLATGAVLAHEVFTANIQPLKPGDEQYAVSFAMPLNAPGIKIMSRKSYEQHAQSEFDNPLSSKFDENDAVIYFDHVKVPWDRVFVYKDVAMAGAQFRDTWAAPMQNHHSQIRLMVKLQFLLGIARKVAETNGVLEFPQVREQLGRMAAYASMVECFTHSMEVTGEKVGSYYAPNRHQMFAATCVTQELYPQFISLIRELSGGGMIMLPSSAMDFENEEVRGYIGKTQRSPVTDSYGRIKMMKLAWDAVGSEFASRHVQYEMFYAGAQVFQRGNMFRTYDWNSATGMVDGLMSQYDLPEVLRP
ncbi:4-hydroxyphenylacetate 3-hydroxylase family protein [Pusillimonas sp.]|uniref:4-hydroxyphenylacetate 3-hydroxylase family protein n=1 Tax=Pusillimonas sp. TaxID=3040095 RepID=UPI0037C857EC